MRRISSLILLVLVSCGFSLLAHNVIIDGGELQSRTVKQILFEGEDVTIVFDDNSTINYVGSMFIDLISTTGVNELRFYDATRVKIDGSGALNVSGLDPKLPITLYTASGQVVGHLAAPNADTVSINVSHLAPGVYLIVSGANTIRFVK